MIQKPRIAIVGAGMGGLAAAAALGSFGFEVQVYEQADQFARIGAGIQMSPNAMTAVRGLGLEDRLRSTAFQPATWNNRVWDTGAMKFELTLGPQAEAQFGAPYLQMHRGDLHAALLSTIPAGGIMLGKRLIDVTFATAPYTLSFTDGTTAEADLVIGADGVHSRVREILLGSEKPVATGRVAYRATFPAAGINHQDHLDHPVSGCTKWWGLDRHIVIYYVTQARDEVYFVTSLPDLDGVHESWSATGDMAVVREAFAGFHDEVGAVLAACPAVHRWAVLEREPLENWFVGNIVLIGDAAHPMTPYMAQGAAMAIEDGVILARALHQESCLDKSMAIFETTRKARTAQVQGISQANTWMAEATDPTWCYGYNPWTAPLIRALE